LIRIRRFFNEKLASLKKEEEEVKTISCRANEMFLYDIIITAQ